MDTAAYSNFPYFNSGTWGFLLHRYVVVMRRHNQAIKVTQ